MKKKTTKNTPKRTMEQPGSNGANGRASRGRMSFKEAKTHVFGAYRDVLKKLAE